MLCLFHGRRWPLSVLVGLLATACGETSEPVSTRCRGADRCMEMPGGDDEQDGGARPSTGDAGHVQGDPSLEGAGMPCAVRKVVREHCTLCHSSPPSFQAPMPLTRRADFLREAHSDPDRKVFELVRERIHAENAQLRMPPTSQEALTTEELSVLDAWLESEVALSEENCGGAQGEEPDAGTVDTDELACHKLTAHAPEDKGKPYAVGTARDAYVNFTFTAPWQGAAYGIVLRPVIDNAQVLHHWLLFQGQAPVVDGAVESSSGVHPDGELVHGWAPGGSAVDFREHGDVGFEFPSGTNFTVEMHYNSDDLAAVDASGVEVCVQKNKPTHIAGVSWLGTDNIFFTTTAESTCDPTSSEPIHILGVSPHMHLKGKHMTALIQRADGSTTTLHDADFSFHDQTWYPKDLTLMPGERITTRCEWTSVVSFGNGTSDEMCYLFTTAYPKGALADGLPWGTGIHGAGACLGM